MSNLSKTLKIYLAGAMQSYDSFDEMNKWRCLLMALIRKASRYSETNVIVINPCDYFNFESKYQQSEREVMDFDLHHVTTSDLIIVNLENIDKSFGTAIELYEAHINRRIPVIALDKNGIYENVHPWIKECITRVEQNEDEIIKYLERFYII